MPSFLSRIGFIALPGLFATFAIDFSYWNWYDFPTKYLPTSLADNTLGWALAGAVLAWWFKPQA